MGLEAVLHSVLQGAPMALLLYVLLREERKENAGMRAEMKADRAAMLELTRETVALGVEMRSAVQEIAREQRELRLVLSRRPSPSLAPSEPG